MDYIIANWNELNLMDRIWFLSGAWLLVLFISVFVAKGIRAIRDKKDTSSETTPTLSDRD